MLLLQTITTQDVITVVGLLLGATAGIWKILEVVINARTKLKEKQHDQSNIIVQAEIDENKTFQEKIVYKVLEQYIEQDKWIREQFATKFELILQQFNEQNTINKDISSQIEIFRRELRTHTDTTKKELTSIMATLSTEQRIRTYIDSKQIVIPKEIKDNEYQ